MQMPKIICLTFNFIVDRVLGCFCEFHDKNRAVLVCDNYFCQVGCTAIHGDVLQDVGYRAETWGRGQMP